MKNRFILLATIIALASSVLPAADYESTFPTFNPNKESLLRIINASINDKILDFALKQKISSPRQERAFFLAYHALYHLAFDFCYKHTLILPLTNLSNFLHTRPLYALINRLNIWVENCGDVDVQLQVLGQAYVKASKINWAPSREHPIEEVDELRKDLEIKEPYIMNEIYLITNELLLSCYNLALKLLPPKYDENAYSPEVSWDILDALPKIEEPADVLLSPLRQWPSIYRVNLQAKL